MDRVSIFRTARGAGPVRWALGACLALAASVVLAPSAGHAATAGGPAAAACAKLGSFTLAAAAIGEPSGGAAVKEAKLVAADPQHTDKPTPFNPSGIVPARPEFCQVTGEIAPVDPMAPPINFEVNLPTQWNGKALQMGGGGFDGNVVNGLGALPRAPDAAPLPINRGFVTFGSDSGHTGNDATFAANAEALTNFAGAQLKKTHDVAVALIKARYGKPATKMYFAGQSEGGREGMTVVQRWPADYDGVVVTAPAMNFAKTMFHFEGVSTAMSQPNGYLNPKKVEALAAAVLDQCDMNDGVKDGIVGNYLGCRFDPTMIRCPRGRDTGDTCLSDAQLATVDAALGPTIWRDDTGKPIVEYPRYMVGGTEGAPGALAAWVFGRNAMPRVQPAGKALTQQSAGTGIAPFYAASAIRYLVTKDPNFQTFAFDARPYTKQIDEIVKLTASDNPDISAFQKRGGKLIMLHNTSDSAVSPMATMGYYDTVVATLGKDTAQSFLRLYIVPGGAHGGDGPVPSKVDLLGMIDTWVTAGKAPGDDWTAEFDGPDQKANWTKPLCAYPYYPRYVGSGDSKVAASYHCVVSR